MFSSLKQIQTHTDTEHNHDVSVTQLSLLSDISYCLMVSEHATVMLMWAWQPHTAVVDFPLCAGTLFQSSYDEFINMCVSETDECNVLSERGVTLKLCPGVICDHTNSSGELV